MRWMLLSVLFLCLAGCEVRQVQPLTQKDMDAVNFPDERVKARVDRLLPFAIESTRQMQTRALAVGTPLNSEGLVLARELGVERPERVRVVVVEKIPKLNTANRLQRAEPLLSLSDRIIGLTAGYGIYLDKEYEDELWVLAHELVHVAQFERMGLEGLTRQVMTEQLALPGRLIPIEREAIDTSARVLRIDPPPYAF
ncbi:MAG: hypothetical protein AAFR98_09850 [Pseudomonadota bacterium]